MVQPRGEQSLARGDVPRRRREVQCCVRLGVASARTDARAQQSVDERRVAGRRRLAEQRAAPAERDWEHVRGRQRRHHPSAHLHVETFAATGASGGGRGGSRRGGRGDVDEGCATLSALADGAPFAVED